MKLPDASGVKQKLVCMHGCIAESCFWLSLLVLITPSMMRGLVFCLSIQSIHLLAYSVMHLRNFFFLRFIEV